MCVLGAHVSRTHTHTHTQHAIFVWIAKRLWHIYACSPAALAALRTSVAASVLRSIAALPPLAATARARASLPVNLDLAVLALRGPTTYLTHRRAVMRSRHRVARQHLSSSYQLMPGTATLASMA